MGTMLFGYLLFAASTNKHLVDCSRSDATDADAKALSLREDLLTSEQAQEEFECRDRSKTITNLFEHKSFTVQDDVMEVHNCLMGGAFNMVFAGRYQGKDVAVRVFINGGYDTITQVPEDRACMNSKKLTAVHHVGMKHFIRCLASGAMQAEGRVYAVSIWPRIQGAKSLQAIGRELVQTSGAPQQVAKVLSNNGLDPRQAAEQIVEAHCALVSAGAIHDDFNPYNMLWMKDAAKGAQLIIVDYDKMDFEPDDFDLPNDILGAKRVLEAFKPLGVDVASLEFCEPSTDRH